MSEPFVARKHSFLEKAKSNGRRRENPVRICEPGACLPEIRLFPGGINRGQPGPEMVRAAHGCFPSSDFPFCVPKWMPGGVLRRMRRAFVHVYVPLRIFVAESGKAWYDK